MVAQDTRRAGLVRRNYDLIILWLGTNVMWLEPNKDWAKSVIADLHEALPRVPVVIFTPPDSVDLIKDKKRRSDPRIVKLQTQLREIAAEPVFDYDVRSTLSSLVAKQGGISDGRKGGVPTPPQSRPSPTASRSPFSLREMGRG